jgi:hypothetical protein
MYAEKSKKRADRISPHSPLRNGKVRKKDLKKKKTQSLVCVCVYFKDTG